MVKSHENKSFRSHFTLRSNEKKKEKYTNTFYIFNEGNETYLRSLRYEYLPKRLLFFCIVTLNITHFNHLKKTLYCCKYIKLKLNL